MATKNGTSLNDTLTGTSTDDVINGFAGDDTLSGAGGNDLLDGGTGNDQLMGGAGDDTLLGGDGTGNDVLKGGPGNDAMTGGAGSDTYYVDSLGDTITENANEGADTVISTIAWTLGPNLESLTLAGTANIAGTGNELVNVITGNSGDNHLYGLGGNDSLSGADGNDTLDGGNGADQLDGGAGNDTLIGSAGDDALIGGIGNDAMAGGSGNDTYYVDSLSDVVTENASEGTDRIYVSVSGYVLPVYVENAFVDGSAAVTLTGNSLANVLTGSTAADTFYGLDGNDKLIGGGGADVLYGGNGNDVLDGGTGNDQMAGGSGNDTYHVDSLSDVVTENARQGTDRIYVSVSGYVLPVNVENGFVEGPGGVTLSGNAVANILTGSTGADTLYGFQGNDGLTGGGGGDYLYGGKGNDMLDGGTGDDHLAGGIGNDTYYVDSLGDVVTENTNEGVDAVHVTVSGYALPNNVENGFVDGPSGLTLSGNGLANSLTGSSGQDVLYGLGGDDTLNAPGALSQCYGGEGNDTLLGSGSDVLDGGPGNDSYTVWAYTYYDWFGGYWAVGYDQVSEAADAGIDTVRVSGVQYYTLAANVENGILLGDGGYGGQLWGNELGNGLTGTDAGDYLYGGAGNDALYGLGGNDNLKDSDGSFTGGGDDTFYGGEGDDLLDSGAGNDLLHGGGGQDTITTGAGNDIIVYDDQFDALFDSTGTPNDIIKDFDVSYDKISLIAIDADQTTDGFQGFHFSGTTWDHTVGDVWLQSDGNGGYYLFAEMNGDQYADMAIDLAPFTGTFTIDNLII